ncbi:MAG: ribosomal protein S18-alanine N-acetyltransferase [Gammaproteobacteria bacterium]|nr:ribosomal protein S18-alanine N-acetyltransferase [Gammaproteobacteria bacterium]
MNRPVLRDTAASTPDQAAVGLTARALTDEDVDAWVDQERQACLHPLHAWTPENYRSSLRAGYWSRVLCAGDRVVAVCVAMDGVDEIHLLNIAVARDWHCQGLALALLQALYGRCVHQRAQALWLEVRPSNARARALYQREGFVDIGVRKHYYPAENGREDALVMRREIQLEAAHALD